MAEQTERGKQWAKIVAKAWADEGYKQRLLDDPAAVMREEGMEVPADMEIKCVEATEKLAWLVLPPKMDTDMITEGEERLAASNLFLCLFACRCC